MLAFFLFFFNIYIFVADNISISMYIMCVTLCLFSALSRRVGAVQISIIIITITISHRVSALGLVVQAVRSESRIVTYGSLVFSNEEIETCQGMSMVAFYGNFG